MNDDYVASDAHVLEHAAEILQRRARRPNTIRIGVLCNALYRAADAIREGRTVRSQGNYARAYSRHAPKARS